MLLLSVESRFLLSMKSNSSFSRTVHCTLLILTILCGINWQSIHYPTWLEYWINASFQSSLLPWPPLQMLKQLLSLTAYILSTLNLQNYPHIDRNAIQADSESTWYHTYVIVHTKTNCTHEKYCRVLTAHGTECFHKLQSTNPQKPNMLE